MDATVESRRTPPKVLGGIAVAFGLLTLFEGGRTLLGGPEARAAAGDVVEFVLRFNVAAGFVYVAAGLSMLRDRPAAGPLASLLAVASALVFAALVGHICAGGAFEARTVVAMVVRTVFWAGTAVFLARRAESGERGLRHAAGA